MKKRFVTKLMNKLLLFTWQKYSLHFSQKLTIRIQDVCLHPVSLRYLLIPSFHLHKPSNSSVLEISWEAIIVTQLVKKCSALHKTNIHYRVYKRPLSDTVHSLLYARCHPRANVRLLLVSHKYFAIYVSTKLRAGAEDGTNVTYGTARITTSI
jgi:hypothetical protein